MKAGIPISLGYFAVAIALGIAARNAGFSPFQAAFTSLLINASAGEYVGFDMVKVGAPILVLALMEFVANARYLLMSASLSQKLRPGVGTLQRLLLGFTVTDEIFGVSMGLPVPLDPCFTYGAFCVATVGWTSGTFVGASRKYSSHVGAQRPRSRTFRYVYFHIRARGKKKQDRRRTCAYMLCPIGGVPLSALSSQYKFGNYNHNSHGCHFSRRRCFLPH